MAPTVEICPGGSSAMTPSQAILAAAYRLQCQTMSGEHQAAEALARFHRVVDDVLPADEMERDSPARRLHSATGYSIHARRRLAGARTGIAKAVKMLAEGADLDAVRLTLDVADDAARRADDLLDWTAAEIDLDVRGGIA
jgi:hypothetical protein